TEGLGGVSSTASSILRLCMLVASVLTSSFDYCEVMMTMETPRGLDYVDNPEIGMNATRESKDAIE
ncbi:unnamed protein product, partial [Brassica rapa]